MGLRENSLLVHFRDTTNGFSQKYLVGLFSGHHKISCVNTLRESTLWILHSWFAQKHFVDLFCRYCISVCKKNSMGPLFGILHTYGFARAVERRDGGRRMR